MAIRQRKQPNKDGKRPWLVELPDPKRPGRTVRVGTYPTEAEAKDAEFEAEKKRRDGRLNTNKTTMTVADLCREFIAYSKARWDGGVIKGETERAYRQHLTYYVIPIIGDVKLKNLKKSIIQGWLLELCRQIPKGTTPLSARSALRSALAYAADEDRGWISPGDLLLWFRKLDMPKRKPHRSHPSRGDLEMFLGHFRRRYPQYELPILIALTTGMRKSEVAGLQWDRCDFSSRAFLVADTVTRMDGVRRGITKSGEERHGVEMVNYVFVLLSHHWNEAGRPTSGIVFPGLRVGETIYGALGCAMGRCMTDLGWYEDVNGRRRLRFSMHSLRRVYVSHVKETLGLDVASESIGHASLEQTKAYCRPMVEHPERRKTVEDLAAMFEPLRALPAPDTTTDTTKTP